MVVIGGIGTFEGPILGALIYFVLRETLSELGPYYLMILGAVAIAIMLIEPRGSRGLNPFALANTSSCHCNWWSSRGSGGN